MRKTVAGAAAAVAAAGLVALLGACAPDPSPVPAEQETARPLVTDQTTSGFDGVGGLGFDVVALDPDGDGLVVHRLGDR